MPQQTLIEPAARTPFRKMLPVAATDSEPRGPAGASNSPAQSQHSRGELARAPRGSKTILVVDANSRLRAEVTAILRELGYKVAEASTGRDAQLRANVKPHIDLLLLNYSPFQPTNLELALWFRAMYPDTRVLVASESLWELNFQLGISRNISVLPKPFTPLELARMVRQVLK
jgi:CheY-like chemotaxis protein